MSKSGFQDQFCKDLIYKTEDQICKLNYRGTKSVIRDKVGDQFYNFALTK